MTNDQLEQTTREDDFDFEGVFAPDYVPAIREETKGVRHPSKASLLKRLRESDAKAADRENGRAF